MDGPHADWKPRRDGIPPYATALPVVAPALARSESRDALREPQRRCRPPHRWAIDLEHESNAPPLKAMGGAFDLVVRDVSLALGDQVGQRPQ